MRSDLERCAQAIETWPYEPERSEGEPRANLSSRSPLQPEAAALYGAAAGCITNHSLLERDFSSESTSVVRLEICELYLAQ